MGPHNLAMKKLTKYTLSAILGIGLSYNANAISFTLNDEFSGGAQPTGSVRLDITDSATNTVKLEITSLLVGTEFMSDLYLNLDPDLNASLLTFGVPTKIGSFNAPSISKVPINADGGGTFDIKFTFSTSGMNGGSQRFNNGDTLTYLVSGITGLDAEDFNFFSQDPSGGHGYFKAAAHIQGIPRDANGKTSGFVGPNGVPDGGTTLMLLGSALACLGALRRRFA
jgi:hypothetical protein